MGYGPTTSRPGQRVLISRDENGIIRRYSDPDTGKPLTRTDAILRLEVDVETGQIVDSFGNSISMRELSLTRSEETRRFLNVTQTTAPLNKDPMQYKPKANEEIIERLIVVGKDGKINKIDISYGSGTRYSPASKGSAWRTKVSEALGLEEDTRLPTADLKRAVVSRQIVVRTTK